MILEGRVISINRSEKRGTIKRPIGRGRFTAENGLEGDVHGAPGKRQISFLAIESIREQQALLDAKRNAIQDAQCPKSHGTEMELAPGSYAENITTENVELHTLPIGARFCFENGAQMEMTQIGKQCHQHCDIFRLLGDCVMPREGIFARVLRDAEIADNETFRVFYIRARVLTISDRCSRGEAEDRGGPAVVEAAQAAGWQIDGARVCPDDADEIRRFLVTWANENVDVILTTGGTGLAPRDVTPEATRAVIDKEIPGMAESMRIASRAETPFADLSRAIVGMRGRTLIINLPGSPRGAVTCLNAVADCALHAAGLVNGLHLARRSGS